MATLDEQMAWEQQIQSAGIARYLAGLERNIEDADGRAVYNESANSYGQRIVRTILLPMIARLTDDVATLGKPQRGRRNEALVMLKELDIDVVAYITSRVVIDGITRARSVASVATTIGARVEDQLRVARFELAAGAYYKAIRESHKAKGTVSYSHVRNTIVKVERNVEDLEPWEAWSARTKLLLGKYLLEVFQEVTDYIDIIEPVTTRGDGSAYMVIPSAKAVTEIQSQISALQGMFPEWLPCLIKPRDWEDVDCGGYYTPTLFRRLAMVKTYTRQHFDMLKANRTKMGRVFRALNALQATPFRINTVVLEAIKEALRTGRVGMPALSPITPPCCPVASDLIDGFKAVEGVERDRLKAELGKRPSVEVLDAALANALTPELWEARQAFMAWKRDASACYTAEHNRRAKALEISRIIAIGDKLSEHPEFYYVYRCDSRGRVYAVGTAVNPQGAKEAKALLEFSRPQRLGQDGYYWLCVHAANVFGVDKEALHDRYEWVRQNSDAIRSVVEGSDFWEQADEPFEFLKVCHELVACWNHVEAVGREGFQSFKSAVSPAMDGSCNGLQHYSMALRDEWGAGHTNLRKATIKDKPADIYMRVRDRAQDALTALVNRNPALCMDGSELDAQYARQWLDFDLERGGVKRPVMVIPYGGTRISCLEYLRAWTVEKALAGHTFGEERLVDTGEGEYVKEGGLHQATQWMGKLLWDCIMDTVTSAQRGMKFLQGVGTAAAKLSNNAGISWSVPGTGFVVHMAPRKYEELRVDTKLLGYARVRITLQEEGEDLDVRAITSAIAPNFIHSCDAAHLMLTICQAKDQGITNFRVIHDSYGTTPGDTTTLHKCIRAQFLGLHEREVFPSFLDQQEDATPELCEASVSKKGPPWRQYLLDSYGDFDRREVLVSPYLFH